jgi:hypothetical protein
MWPLMAYPQEYSVQRSVKRDKGLDPLFMEKCRPKIEDRRKERQGLE